MGKNNIVVVILSKDYYISKYVPASKWYAKKAARNEYFNAEKINYEKSDLYIPQILNEEMKADDPLVEGFILFTE